MNLPPIDYAALSYRLKKITAPFFSFSKTVLLKTLKYGLPAAALVSGAGYYYFGFNPLETLIFLNRGKNSVIAGALISFDYKYSLRGLEV